MVSVSSWTTPQEITTRTFATPAPIAAAQLDVRATTAQGDVVARSL